jgi:ferredoxin
VAIVGAGPTGLAAAWHLLQEGHACTLFDDRDKPGGMLRYDTPREQLPSAVLDAEIALVARLGAEFRMGTHVGRDVLLSDLHRQFGAVLIASGAVREAHAGAGGPDSPQGIQVDRKTYQLGVPGLFAAGDVVQPRRLAVREIADGAAAAESIAQYLAGLPVTGPYRPFTTRLGMPGPDELARFLAGASPAGRVAPAGGEAAGLSADEARREAPRCLHCDCRKPVECKLRRYAEAYSASPGRYHGTRRRFEQDLWHPDVVYESGKCISCGLCIQVAARAKEPLGLAFIGRGFNVRVGVPFNEAVAEGLRRAAAACVAACPTGALAMKSGT